MNLLEHAWTFSFHRGGSVMEGLCVGYLIPLDLFLWGYVKDVAYRPPIPGDLLQLRDRFQFPLEFVTAEMLSSLWEEIEYWLDVCHVIRVDNIERS
jgi:hypothetical protein